MEVKPMRQSVAVFCLIVSSSFCGFAQGAEFTFTKIVDTNTIIPGLNIAFTGFGLPSIDAGKIVFRIDFNDSSSGIYLAEQLSMPPVGVMLKGTGATDFETFNSLGEVGDALPPAWHVNIGNSRLTTITQPYPPQTVSAGTYNAEFPNTDDPSLGIGITSGSSGVSIEHEFIIIDNATRAIRLTYDIEAWAANPNADNPGEAAFQTTLEVDGETVIDFGTTTTGKVLTPGLLNGNESPNRVSFDSGVVEISIPTDTPAKINWSVPAESSTSGWLFGLDNVVFRTLAAGDVQGDGIIDPSDLTILLTADTFGKVDIDATWSQGYFDNDGDFDATDISAILQAVAGEFPKTFAGDEIGSIEAASAVVVPEPSSFVLCGIGFLLIVFCRHGRRRAIC